MREKEQLYLFNIFNSQIITFYVFNAGCAQSREISLAKTVEGVPSTASTTRLKGAVCPALFLYQTGRDVTNYAIYRSSPGIPLGEILLRTHPRMAQLPFLRTTLGRLQ